MAIRECHPSPDHGRWARSGSVDACNPVSDQIGSLQGNCSEWGRHRRLTAGCKRIEYRPAHHKKKQINTFCGNPQTFDCLRLQQVLWRCSCGSPNCYICAINLVETHEPGESRSRPLIAWQPLAPNHDRSCQTRSMVSAVVVSVEATASPLEMQLGYSLATCLKVPGVEPIQMAEIELPRNSGERIRSAGSAKCSTGPLTLLWKSLFEKANKRMTQQVER